MKRISQSSLLPPQKQSTQPPSTHPPTHPRHCEVAYCTHLEASVTTAWPFVLENNTARRLHCNWTARYCCVGLEGLCAASEPWIAHSCTKYSLIAPNTQQHKCPKQTHHSTECDPRSQTFKDQILRLQVKPLSVALSPQSGDGGVVLPYAVGLHGRGGRREVPLSPQQHFAADTGASTFHIFILWHHAKWKVVVGDVNVAGVVSFV